MTDLESLRPWIDERARQGLFSGVALVMRGDETLFEHAAGLAHRGHGVPIDIETRFQIASVTKMITAVTALKMVEEGSLSLNRPLTAFLPPQYRPIGLDDRHTLHHLLSHTSGLANYFDDEDETWESFTRALDRIPASRARRPLDLLPLFAELPPVADPGEFIYCDANFVLVGLLIEWVTGRRFSEVAEEKVLVPAGMTRSGFFDVDLEPDGFATGYVVSEDPVESWRSNLFGLTAGAMPDAGMTSTAHDLDRFLHALRSGVTLSPASFALMLTPHGTEEDGTEAEGYGMELVVERGKVLIFGHSGSGPGVSANVSHFVEPGITIVVLCNYDRGAWAAVQKIVETLGLNDPRE